MTRFPEAERLERASRKLASAMAEHGPVIRDAIMDAWGRLGGYRIPGNSGDWKGPAQDCYVVQRLEELSPESLLITARYARESLSGEALRAEQFETDLRDVALKIKG